MERRFWTNLNIYQILPPLNKTCISFSTEEREYLFQKFVITCAWFKKRKGKSIITLQGRTLPHTHQSADQRKEP